MKIETITKADRTIVQVGFEDDIRIDMQEKIKQLYRLQSPLKDFSKHYPFDIHQLSDWEEVLDWEEVSSNRQIKWSVELINRFKDKLHLFNLWLNEAVLCWNTDLLKEFEDKIAWDFILNTSIQWNEELHNKFEKHLTSSLYEYDNIVKHTTANREKFIKQGGKGGLSEAFEELYLHAKKIDDEQGIFILFDAVEVYLNSKANIVPIKYNSSPL